MNRDEERRALAWDTNSARIQRSIKLMRRNEVMLICPNGHDHIISDGQMHLADGPCPWCKEPLRIKAHGYR